jgi:hypothetical protein
MGKAHAVAQAAIAQAQTDEAVREAEARRASAERERQLLASYLGSKEQAAGSGVYSNVSPEVLKYTQRYAIDQRELSQIQAAGQGIKNQLNPFQSADNSTRGGLSLQDYSQGFATKANDLLAQAEAAARTGDLGRAEQLYTQAQTIISGVQPEAQSAYNLGSTPESAAVIRASSAEGQIVGRQLLAAKELGDPNSERSVGLRSRLLDPTLGLLDEGTNQAVGALDAGVQNATGAIDEGARQAQLLIDENTRNAERAIAAERSQIDGQIRQTGTGGGVGVNARAQLALQSQAASQAARERAQVYTTAAGQRAGVLGTAADEKAQIIATAQAQKAGIYSQAGAQKAAAAAQVNLYLNEFAKRMAEDSVTMAQNWVNGTAGVRDEYQQALDQFDTMAIQIANQRAQFLQQVAEQRRQQEAQSGNFIKGALAGLSSGITPLIGAASGLFGGGGSTPAAESNGGGGAFGGLGEEAGSIVGMGSEKSGSGDNILGTIASVAPLIASFFL